MATERTTFVKNTALILAANVLVLAISFFLRPLIARFIGPDQYGVFALILTTSMVVTAFTAFSMNSAVLYFVSKHHGQRQKVGQTMGSACWFVTALFAAFFVPLWLLIPALVSEITWWPFATAYVLSYASVMLYLLQAGQQGLEKFRDYSATLFLSTFLAGVLSVGAAYFFGDALAAAALRVAGLAAVVIAGFSMLKLAWGFNRTPLNTLLRYATPLAVGGWFGSFYAVVDRYLIAHFHPTAEVGFYDVSYALVVAVIPFASTFFTVMSPRVIKNTESFPTYFKNISRATTLAVTGFALAAFYFSDVIVTLLLGSEYLAATPMIKVLALAVPFMALYGLNATSLNALGKTKLSSGLAVLLLASLLALNLFLVQPLGGVGAAWATVAAYALVTGLGIAYVRVRHRVTVRPVATQLALFYAFVLAYGFLVEPWGFKAKAAAFVAFSLTTLALNRDLIQSVLADAHLSRFIEKWKR
ncbi:oligosaccharide flippase family protein [Candidatus Micrarchaeota archaeon]|nr:oligosaccharide flippase family protein [Candidatus Micrarchaeota archaeon]